jgi:3-dehydroquinate synthase
MNDLTREELNEALHAHKAICSQYAREGDGIDMYVQLDEPQAPIAVGVRGSEK